MLFMIVFVPYAVVRGCTRESNGIVGRSIHDLVGCELFITVMVTLVAAWSKSAVMAGVVGRYFSY